MLSSKKKKFLISSSEIAFGLNPWTWKGQQELAFLPWIRTVVSYQCNTYFVYYHRIPINHLEHPHLESVNILPIRSRARLLFTISPKWRACSQANSRTVTSSDCKVKKARFYEFLFTLGWRLIGNKSLYKFPAPKYVSFRKYSSLNFRVFTVRDTKIGMLSPWKKSLRLIFSSLTISSIRRYVYAQVC